VLEQSIGGALRIAAAVWGNVGVQPIRNDALNIHTERGPMRAQLLLLTLSLAAMAPSTIVHADECANAMDQATMNECQGKAYKKSDAELNNLYKQIERRIKDPAPAKLLAAAQRAWVSFRDAECDFSASGVSGGSVYPMIYAQCMDEVTRARVKDLKKYLACEEGDMICPVPAH
jgi:uncharacterized protein YecT (DUF1311 family)